MSDKTRTSEPLCACCGVGKLPKIHLAMPAVRLRKYTCINRRLEADIHLHDNCIVEFLQSRTGTAIAWLSDD